jgi:monovalent cation/hydrogen antiporter
MAPLPIRALSHFGTHEELQLLLLLVVAVGLLLLSQPLRIPYPILLVLGGLGLGFVPGVPNVIMPPDVVLFGILPPLLYTAAFSTGLRELRQNLQAISMLAVGLVAVTMLSVAVVGHYAIHLSWAPAFVLGAVVAPTDPLAASAIGRRFGVPRRALAILEGESLVNDGTALVLFKFAVAAVVAGSFSLPRAALDLVWTVVGGLVVGLVIGHAIRLVRRRLDNPPLEITIAFLTGYLTYLPATALGVSGVLAVVTAGVYMGWHTPELTTVETRLQGNGFWAILSFLLNSLLFGLVGLQLRPILDRLSGHSAWELIGYGVAAAGAVIVTRILFAFPFTYIRSRGRDGRPPLRNVAFVSWAGMRGAITIAAALAIPLTTNSGAPFPHRDLIVYLAFCVVFATLVGQGLTLPFVIRLLGLEDDGLNVKEEAKARIHAADAALARLEELVDEGAVRPDTAQRLRGQYEFRRNRFRARFDDEDDGEIEERSQSYQRVRRELLDAERSAIVGLRNEGRIAEEVMHRLERDLDLEDSRLDV